MEEELKKKESAIFKSAVEFEGEEVKEAETKDKILEL